MPRPLQICIESHLAARLVGGCERGRAGLGEPGSGAELAFELRPHHGPAPSRRELATLPAASGGRPGRCDPAALGAAAEVAAGTSRRRCPEGRTAQRRLSAALCSATRSRGGGGCRWVRRGSKIWGSLARNAFIRLLPLGPLQCLRSLSRGDAGEQGRCKLGTTAA